MENDTGRAVARFSGATFVDAAVVNPAGVTDAEVLAAGSNGVAMIWMGGEENINRPVCAFSRGEREPIRNIATGRPSLSATCSGSSV
jgi:hypothetical protein